MTDSYQKIVNAVRSRRKALGITQLEASKMCGVSIEFMNRIENGKETIQIDKALGVMEKLGIDIEVIARGLPENISTRKPLRKINFGNL